MCPHLMLVLVGLEIYFAEIAMASSRVNVKNVMANNFLWILNCPWKYLRKLEAFNWNLWISHFLISPPMLDPRVSKNHREMNQRPGTPSEFTCFGSTFRTPIGGDSQGNDKKFKVPDVDSHPKCYVISDHFLCSHVFNTELQSQKRRNFIKLYQSSRRAVASKSARSNYYTCPNSFWNGKKVGTQPVLLI